jgi:hypothetical protein
MGRRDFFKAAAGTLGISALSYYLGLRDRPVADDQPDYIDGGIGLPSFRGPFLQKDVQLAAFLYSAEISSLTALCDQTLNAVSSSSYKYVPLMSSVLLVYANMLVSSLDERDALVGSIPETEVGFWILTMAMQKTSAGDVPHHLAWFLPTVLINESNSIATGREVYGFNKQAATFSEVQDIQSAEFTADVLGFETFSPQAIAQNQRLLQVSSSSLGQPSSSAQDFPTLREYILEQLKRNIRADLDGSTINFVAEGLTQDIPLVFLKQTRSASNARKADTQKIVEAPFQISEFVSGSVFDQSYTLNIMPLDSHPLARRLGLKPEQTASVGAWLKVDFILGLGVEY